MCTTNLELLCKSELSLLTLFARIKRKRKREVYTWYYNVCFRPAQLFYAMSKNDNANVLSVDVGASGSSVKITKRREDRRNEQLWYEDKYGNIRSALNHMVMDTGKGMVSSL